MFGIGEPHIANMDPDDNIDDILRLHRKVHTRTEEGGGRHRPYGTNLVALQKRNRALERMESHVFDYPLGPETVPVQPLRPVAAENLGCTTELREFVPVLTARAHRNRVSPDKLG
jgi:hypothetical protein